MFNSEDADGEFSLSLSQDDGGGCGEKFRRSANSITQNLRGLVGPGASSSTPIRPAPCSLDVAAEDEEEEDDDAELAAALEAVESQQQERQRRETMSPSPRLDDSAVFKIPSTSPSLRRCRSPASPTAPPMAPPPSPPKPQRRLSSPLNTKKRKFPGPAGVLDAGSHGGSRLPTWASDQQEDKDSPRTTEAASTSTEVDSDLFDRSSSWQKVLRDRGIDERDPSAESSRFNSSWVRRKTCPGTNKRAPIFLCLLKSIDLTTMDPSCVLADRAGCVSATIHRDVLERYGPYFVPGAALVLKNVPVIMAARHHYMLVTVNNLVTLYRPKDGGGTQGKEVCKVTKEDLERAARAIEEEERRMKRNAASRIAPSLPTIGHHNARFVHSTPMHQSPQLWGSRPMRPPRPLAPVQNFRPPPVRPTATPVNTEVRKLFEEGVDEDALFGDF